MGLCAVFFLSAYPAKTLRERDRGRQHHLVAASISAGALSRRSGHWLAKIGVSAHGIARRIFCGSKPADRQGSLWIMGATAVRPCSVHTTHTTIVSAGGGCLWLPC